MARLLGRIFNRKESDCTEVRRLGSDYLEDDLPPRRRSAVQTHLDKCGPCRAFIETLSLTIAMLARIPQATPPPSLRDSIIERANQENPSGSGD